MSAILDFYNGIEPNQQGFYFYDIIDFSDEMLEKNHCYIQWLFPLRESSKVVPDAPILDDSDIETFMESNELRKKVLLAYNRMMGFLGLRYSLEKDPSDKSGEYYALYVIKDENTYKERSKIWLTPKNHNFLRITRILTSLRELGLETASSRLYSFLCKLYEEEKGIIGPLTKQFWDEAMKKNSV